MANSFMAFLGLDATAFHAGMRNATGVAKAAGSEISSSLGAFAKTSLMGIGAAAGVVGMEEIIRRTLEATEHISQLSKEFRVSSETIQVWEKGAHEVGMTADDIGNALNRLKKAREKAISEGDTGAFGSFGISLYDLNNQAISTEEIMDRMRAKASEGPITDEQDVAGMELMGRSGAKVLSAMQAIHELGPIPVIADEDIRRLHEANETLEEIKRTITVKTATVLSSIPQAFRGWRDFFQGKISFSDMSQAPETGNVAAPKFDLKGRPLTQEAKKAVQEQQQHAATVQNTKNQTKQITELEKSRDDLAKKIFDNHLKTLTTIQKQAELKKEIAQHEENANLAMRIGNELLSNQERLKAEDLRGQLANSHKAERMDFTSAEKIGAFANVSALHGSMGHAESTAKNTHDTFVAVQSLLSTVKGYVIKKGDIDRRKITHEAVRGVRFD